MIITTIGTGDDCSDNYADCTGCTVTTYDASDGGTATTTVNRGPTELSYYHCYADLYKPLHDLVCRALFEGNWDNWWDWFRTGWFRQDSMKKWTVKQTNRYLRAFWLRCLPSKSGWVGKAMARRKGA